MLVEELEFLNHRFNLVVEIPGTGLDDYSTTNEAYVAEVQIWMLIGMMAGLFAQVNTFFSFSFI